MQPPFPSQILRPLLAAVRRSAGAWLGAALLLTMTGGCEDPVLHERVAALGEEAPGVPAGPLHRPGQPCLLCHADSGRAGRFTVAGSVFQTPDDARPLGGIAVRLIDASRREFVAYSNCAGNFFVYPQEYEPTLPLWVSLSGHGIAIDMESPMNKDGDCGTCHQGKKSPTSAGSVYLTDDPARSAMIPTGACGGARP